MAKRETVTDRQRAEAIVLCTMTEAFEQSHYELDESRRAMVGRLFPRTIDAVESGIHLGRALATRGGKSTKKGKNNGKA